MIIVKIWSIKMMYTLPSIFSFLRFSFSFSILHLASSLFFVLMLTLDHVLSIFHIYSSSCIFCRLFSISRFLCSTIDFLSYALSSLSANAYVLLAAFYHLSSAFGLMSSTTYLIYSAIHLPSSIIYFLSSVFYLLSRAFYLLPSSFYFPIFCLWLFSISCFLCSTI